jgi:hypothetical protein
MTSLEEIGRRVVDAFGPTAALELFDALTRPEDRRASLIGRLSQREDASWLAELLVDLEMDEPARLQLAEAIRLQLASP